MGWENKNFLKILFKCRTGQLSLSSERCYKDLISQPFLHGRPFTLYSLSLFLLSVFQYAHSAFSWPPKILNFVFLCAFFSFSNQKCRPVVKGRAKGWDEWGEKAFEICKDGEGCYSILSIKNNSRFYIHPGLQPQSTGLEFMKNHMSSLRVCLGQLRKFFVGGFEWVREHV